MLYLYKEKRDGFQDIKDNQLTNEDKDKIRPISIANNLNSPNLLVYPKLPYVSESIFCVVVFVEVFVLPKEDISLYCKFLTTTSTFRILSFHEKCIGFLYMSKVSFCCDVTLG